MIDWCDKIMINKREHLLLGEVDNEAGSFFFLYFCTQKKGELHDSKTTENSETRQFYNASYGRFLL